LGGGGKGAALTFGRLRHGGGQAVHVVAAVAVIAEEELVLSRGGGRGGKNLVILPGFGARTTRRGPEGTRVPLHHSPRCRSDQEDIAMSSGVPKAPSAAPQKRFLQCPTDKSPKISPQKGSPVSYRPLKLKDFTPERFSCVLQTIKAQRFHPGKVLLCPTDH